MIIINHTTEVQYAYVPMTRGIANRDTNHKLVLEREGTGKNFEIEIISAEELRDFCKITFAADIDEGEYRYCFDNIEQGLIQVGEYKHTASTYNSDREIIYYNND